MQAWSRDTLSLPPDASLTTIKSNFINSLVSQILRTPLLSRISDLQRTLDPLDCEGLGRLIELSPNGDLTQPAMEDWISFIETFLSSNNQKCSVFSPSNLRYHTLAYLLSVTFKDCSLIIPLRRSLTGTESGCIRVIDLDIKSVDKIPYWINLDQTIVKEYTELEAGLRKTCVDGRFEHHSYI